MEASRLGGALLAAVATGVGIMVPYTFKTMSTPLMAVIWAALVFAGIVGLILALRPEAQGHSEGQAVPRAPKPKRDPLIDPEVMSIFGGVLIFPALMLGFLVFMGLLIALIRGLMWLIGS